MDGVGAGTSQPDGTDHYLVDLQKRALEDAEELS